MKEYKVEPSRISEFARRMDQSVLKVLVFTGVSVPLLMLPMTQQKGAPKELIWLIAFSTIFTYLILLFIYLNNRRLTKRRATNLRIVIDEESITRSFDSTSESSEATTNGFYTQIKFSDIKKLERKKAGLDVHSVHSNSFNGSGIIHLPIELSGFEEVEKLLREKALKKNR